MKNALIELQKNLEWFVEQNEHLTLVVSATDPEAAYVLKMLEVVEGPRDGDLFLCFAHELHDANSYIDELVANLRLQIAGANEQRAEDDLPPWPDLPEACDDPRQTPSMRVRHVLEYVRERVPNTEHTIVLALLPFVIHDQHAYSTLVQSLFPWNGIEPWMAGVRIVLRDDRNAPFVIPSVVDAQLDHVVYYDDLDLSHEALCGALEESATSTETGDHDRMMATVQLAALDQSYKRYDEAYLKWGLVYDFYESKKVPAMQALALGGAGDVLRQLQRVPEAKEKYQSGLSFAKSEQELPVSLNLLLGVSDCCIDLEQWEEAEGYLDLADQTATALHQLWVKCDILDKLGVVMVARGKNADAVARWRACVDLSRELKYYERAESALEHLIAMYAAAEMSEEQAAAEQDLRTTKQEQAAFEAQGGVRGMQGAST